MLASLVDFVEEFLIPGSFSFLFLGLSGGVVLLYGRGWGQRWGRRWLSGLVGLYVALSLPLVSGCLEAGLLRNYAWLDRASDAKRAKAVVMLTGGGRTYRARGQEIVLLSPATSFRALESARLYGILDNSWVIVSGTIGHRGKQQRAYESLREIMAKAGVPSERILLEETATNTREQALKLVPLLRARQIDHFVLVTSPAHMLRALATFKAQGLQPVPSVSADGLSAMSTGVRRFLPSLEALGASRYALREYLALAYYWARGWL